MNKIFPVAILLLLIFSCSKEEKNFVTIAGKIENASADSVYIVSENVRKAIALQEGEFVDTLKVSTSGYYKFYSGRERTEIFLIPGDSLFISTNMEEFDEKLIYGGTSAAENNYLAAKQLKIESLYTDPSEFYSTGPDAFKSNLNEFKSKLDADLSAGKFNSEFKKLESKNIQYYYLVMLAQYPMAYKYFTQSEVALPENFDESKDIDFQNEADFISVPTYREFVFLKTSVQLDEAKTWEEKQAVISNLSSSKIKDATMKEFLMYYIESGSADAEQYHDFIQNNAQDEKLKKTAADAFAKVQKLLPGNPSPKFSYPDINGKMVSLDDLKGKLVYIDVWATWCGPCIREIPSLKQLEADYHGKNIAFVSMSIDPQEDFDKWQKMVKDKDLKGIQIFADKDWKSDFVQEYGIKGIPRFILIDQNGNILVADAPRPSDPEIRTLLDQNS